MIIMETLAISFNAAAQNHFASDETQYSVVI